MSENKIIDNINSNISNGNLITSEEMELNNLNPEELIISLDQLIDSDTPFSVSKKVEIIKALFYKKFNNLEQNKESETLQNNFKKIYNLFRKKRNDFRKMQEQKEKEIETKGHFFFLDLDLESDFEVGLVDRPCLRKLSARSPRGSRWGIPPSSTSSAGGSGRSAQTNFWSGSRSVSRRRLMHQLCQHDQLYQLCQQH